MVGIEPRYASHSSPDMGIFVLENNAGEAIEGLAGVVPTPPRIFDLAHLNVPGYDRYAIQV